MKANSVLDLLPLLLLHISYYYDSKQPCFMCFVCVDCGIANIRIRKRAGYFSGWVAAAVSRIELLCGDEAM